MRVLVACEFSGIVREAFCARGHDAWSCDLLETEIPSARHFRCDVLDVMRRYEWDLMIAFPPCTHLAVSGARWFKDKRQEQEGALHFVRLLLDAPIARIALENPIGVISTRIRKPDQIIQPWQFGHGEVKGDLPVAQEPAAPRSDEDRARKEGARLHDAGHEAALEEEESNVRGRRRGDGRTVGVRRC